MTKKSILLIVSTVVILVFANSLTAQRGGRGALSESGRGTISSNIGATSVDGPNGGALLESVDDSGRASRFGLEEGDIVLSINDQRVSNAESFLELMGSVERGAAVSIQVLRDGNRMTVGREAMDMGGRGGAATDDTETQTPGARGGTTGTGTRGGFNRVLTVNVLSELLDLARQNNIEELTARLEALLEEAQTTASARGGVARGGMGAMTSNIGVTSVDGPNGGALLESVDASGRASRFGLEEGDIVLSIDGQTVEDAESFMELISNVGRGAAVSIQVLRDGVEMTVGREARGGRGGMRGGERGGVTIDRSEGLTI